MDAVCGSDLQCPVRGDRRRQESARARRGGDRSLATIDCDRRVRRGVLPPRACGAATHVIGVRSAAVSGYSRKLLTVVIAHDEARFLFLDEPRLAGSGAQACLDQEARSTLTTLNRGSRSAWMFKAKPPGQAVSARRSATVFAVTATPVSTS